MILVESVKVINSERDDYIPLLHYEMPNLVKDGLMPEYAELAIDKNIDVVEELVRGKRFTNAVGKTVIVGWSEQVQEAIGLPMEAFRNQEKRIGDLIYSKRELSKEKSELVDSFHEFQNQSIWSFIKYKIKRRFKK